MNRQGDDVVRDGSKIKPKWDPRYYQLSCKNNTPEADASVDQYSIAMVMLQVLLGRRHPLFKYAVQHKKVIIVTLLTPSPLLMVYISALFQGGPGAAPESVVFVTVGAERVAHCKITQAHHRGRAPYGF